MNNIDVLQDINKLTTIPVHVMQKLGNIATNCISWGIKECIDTDDNCLSVNLDIGTLYIRFNNNEIVYHFEPATKLDDAIKETIETGESSLSMTVEDILVQKIMHTYKDIL